jgi:processive 1,2-diacylglycerol beta-glucosyltransferase
MDLVIVYSPVGGGHKAAAMATLEAARARGLSAEVLDLFALAPKIVGKSYVRAHLTGQNSIPELYGSAYFAANRTDGVFDPMRRGIDQLAFGALLPKVQELAPRAIIATHHLPLVILGAARARGELEAPLVGVVTDYTSHACWAERGVDAFCVPCPRALRELEEHHVARDRIALTGIPVRSAFGAIDPVREPRTGERLRVLVTSGGFGVGPMRKVVRSFAGMTDIELTVVCGNAERLVDEVRRDAEAFDVRANVIGFEKDMAARVAEAHVVVGKAGGLTVSETLTAGRPMVIVGAVPGNEKINEQMVVDAKAGYAASPEQVGALVAWVHRSGQLRTMGQRARARVRANAAGNVLDVATWLANRSAVRLAA